MSEGDWCAQITAPHFCAGIVLRNDAVVDAAPILRWMIGKSRDEVRAYCTKKGWTVRVSNTN